MDQIKVLVMGGVSREYHDFSVMGPIYRRFLNQAGFAVTISEDKDLFLSENIKDFDAIICYTTHGSLTNEQSKGLREGIIGGKPKGFMGIHGAACSFENDESYLRMLGGRFLTHPQLGPEFRFHIENPSHPVMRGIQDFSLADELYLLETFPPFENLISCLYEDFPRPVAWVKPYGLGRIFYFALGHDVKQTENPVFQRIIINALRWMLHME